jgi:DNA-directed RNA polymerase specialized sigma24 family protein
MVWVRTGPGGGGSPPPGPVHFRFRIICRRTAFLLRRDWHLADNLVSITIGKLYRHWPRARQVQHLDAYVRRILVRTWLDEKARVWRREEPAETLPESPGLPTDEVVERLGLLEPLDALLDPGLTLYP